MVDCPNGFAEIEEASAQRVVIHGVPIVAKVGPVALIAVVVALGSMILKRNEFIAAGLGLVAASLARAYGL